MRKVFVIKTDMLTFCSKLKTSLFYRASICEGGLGSRNSVRLSVCVSHAWIVTNLNGTLQIFWYHTKGQSLCYSDTNNGWWAMPPSLWNLRSKWPNPLRKTLAFFAVRSRIVDINWNITEFLFYDCACDSVVTCARLPDGCAVPAVSVVAANAASLAVAPVVCLRSTCTANDTSTRVGIVTELDTSGQRRSLYAHTARHTCYRPDIYL